MLTSRLKTLHVIYPDKILENNKMLWHIKDNLNFSNTKRDDKRHFTEKVEKRGKIKCPCKSLRLSPHVKSRHHFARALFRIKSPHFSTSCYLKKFIWTL